VIFAHCLGMSDVLFEKCRSSFIWTMLVIFYPSILLFFVKFLSDVFCLVGYFSGVPK